jgi:hypothetical protein
MTKSDYCYAKASEHSFYNYDEITKSQNAGCYHCIKHFSASIINEKEHCIASTPQGTQEPTVFCPLCGIDAVIGDSSGYPVTNTGFLTYMYSQAFNVRK